MKFSMNYPRNMKKIFTALAILSATVVHVISGSALASIGRIHAFQFAGTDSELPLISELAFNYTATGAPLIIGLFLAAATLVGLGLIFRSSRFQWLLPFLLSISFVTAIVHIMLVVFGVTIPLLRTMAIMSEQ